MANPQTDKTEKPNDAAPAAPRWRWILNNEERHKSIQLPATFMAESKTLAPGPIVSLLPGWNLLESAQWEILKRNPQVQRELDNEIPMMAAPEFRRECAGKPYLVEGPEVSDKAAPLASINEREAKSMIREIFDDRLLRSLRSVEKRSPVSAALGEALEKIERAAAKGTARA